MRSRCSRAPSVDCARGRAAGPTHGRSRGRQPGDRATGGVPATARGDQGRARGRRGAASWRSRAPGPAGCGREGCSCALTDGLAIAGLTLGAGLAYRRFSGESLQPRLATAAVVVVAFLAALALAGSYGRSASGLISRPVNGSSLLHGLPLGVLLAHARDPRARAARRRGLPAGGGHARRRAVLPRHPGDPHGGLVAGGAAPAAPGAHRGQRPGRDERRGRGCCAAAGSASWAWWTTSRRACPRCSAPRPSSRTSVPVTRSTTSSSRSPASRRTRRSSSCAAWTTRCPCGSSPAATSC